MSEHNWDSMSVDPNAILYQHINAVTDKLNTVEKENAELEKTVAQLRWELKIKEAELNSLKRPRKPTPYL